jgi:hypothetical protein
MEHPNLLTRPQQSQGAADQRVRVRCLLLCSALVLGLAGCGGGGGGDSTVVTPPPPPPPPPPVSGPAWNEFAKDAQHSAQDTVATQALSRIQWQTPVDLAPQYDSSGELLIHYGSPVATSQNTVLVPVKTTATGVFGVNAVDGATGATIWSASSDYILPVHDWTPSFNLAVTAGNRVYLPGSGGKLLFRDNADSASGTVQSVVFFGSTAYAANSALYDAAVFIDTPVTVDSQGNVFFGFIVTGSNPAGLSSGVARIGADGTGSWVAASAVSGNALYNKVAMNSAPALSPDNSTLYVAVNSGSVFSGQQAGLLLALDSSTLAPKSAIPLLDPTTGTAAMVSDDSTASPTVGPDGDVFFGVLESNFGAHNGRGWLLHFDAGLIHAKTPGSFGWDDTASIVPASAVASYTGTSSYLLATKYNNYGGIGSGDGKNRMAVLDPGQPQADSISGIPVMHEVLTILGPTTDPDYAGGVTEWCVNTVAVDPLTHSILVNNEDGNLYRWDLSVNQLTQKVKISTGIGEAYTPTAIGPGGSVFAINNAILFSVGQ